jgi:hypothetical protein
VKPVQALIPEIEQYERDAASVPEPMSDIFMLGIPMPTYKALSDEAAKRNMTFAQLLGRAFTLVLSEEVDRG